MVEITSKIDYIHLEHIEQFLEQAQFALKQ